MKTPWLQMRNTASLPVHSVQQVMNIPTQQLCSKSAILTVRDTFEQVACGDCGQDLDSHSRIKALYTLSKPFQVQFLGVNITQRHQANYVSRLWSAPSLHVPLRKRLARPILHTR